MVLGFVLKTYVTFYNVSLINFLLKSDVVISILQSNIKHHFAITLPSFCLQNEKVKKVICVMMSVFYKNTIPYISVIDVS